MRPAARAPSPASAPRPGRDPGTRRACVRLGALLLIAAALAAAVAPRFAVAGRVAIWALAGSAAVYAALYLVKALGLDPERRPPGTFLQLLGAPYTGIYWGVLVASRLLAGSAPHDEIAPGLLLGALPLPWHRQRLARRRLSGVVNLCYEFPHPSGTPERVERLSLLTLDGTAPERERTLAATAWIENRLDRGPVLIHCAQGHGRSATLACAVLLRIGLAKTIDEALERVREARPRARLNADQRALLEML
jgi:hypothetical protein